VHIANRYITISYRPRPNVDSSYNGTFYRLLIDSSGNYLNDNSSNRHSFRDDNASVFLDFDIICSRGDLHYQYNQSRDMTQIESLKKEAASLRLSNKEKAIIDVYLDDKNIDIDPKLKKEFIEDLQDRIDVQNINTNVLMTADEEIAHEVRLAELRRSRTTPEDLVTNAAVRRHIEKVGIYNTETYNQLIIKSKGGKRGKFIDDKVQKEYLEVELWMLKALLVRHSISSIKRKATRIQTHDLHQERNF
jgi:hypothetical protein